MDLDLQHGGHTETRSITEDCEALGWLNGRWSATLGASASENGHSRLVSLASLQANLLEPRMPSFRLTALSPEPFRPLFDRSDAELAAMGARRVVATHTPGFPCRVSLVDAEPGEELILLPYEHHAVDSPYCASGAIYVRRAAVESRALEAGELPPYVTRRLMSLRAYDADGMMLAADVVDGAALGAELERHFADARVAYIHLHNAKPGCFSCEVVRA